MVSMEKVYAVYSGKLYKCCCGCTGKYSYTNAGREYANIHRGYPVSDSQISDRSVKTIAKKVLKDPRVKISGSKAILEDEVKGRVYFVFFFSN